MNLFQEIIDEIKKDIRYITNSFLLTILKRAVRWDFVKVCRYLMKSEKIRNIFHNFVEEAVYKGTDLLEIPKNY